MSWLQQSRSQSCQVPPRQRRRVLSALPEILAGIRLGVIRGVKGVVIGQLLVSIIGVGALFSLYSQNFLMAHKGALLFPLHLLLLIRKMNAPCTLFGRGKVHTNTSLP